MAWRVLTFRSLQLMTICFVIINCKLCPHGWFGPQCEYKCHCKDTMCFETGECINTTCEHGYFEYLCQYVNAMELPRTKVTGDPKSFPMDWLTDNSDSTCNSYGPLTSITVKFEKHIVFTWLQLTMKHGQTAEGITVQFKYETNHSTTHTLDCYDKALFALPTSSSRFEIRCYYPKAISQLILYGSDLFHLCGLQVNMGRNVALKQDTSLVGDWQTRFPGTSQLAVDGNTSSSFKACAPPVPEWTVTFKTDFIITQVDLYNREDYASRLLLFEIAGYNARKDLKVYHQGYGATGIPFGGTLNEYWKKPWRNIAVTSEKAEEAMALCEVEAFGECPPKRAKLECESCEGRCLHGSCFRDGTCMDGCVGTATPPLCLRGCLPFKWGVKCDKTCYNCFNGSCDQISGVCIQGCVAYSNPPTCTIECKPETWGKDCAYSCFGHCRDAPCNRQDGLCSLGCVNGYYGGYCSLPCPAKCDDNKCDNYNGYCLQCSTGHQGALCDKECVPGTWGKDCKFSCSINCSDASCDGNTGFCDQGCVKGFYGDTCSLPCPERCQAALCDRMDRSCLKCVPGYNGQFCEDAISQVQPISAREKILILSIGLGVGFIVLMFLLCVMCICCMTGRKRSKPVIKRG